MCYGPTSQDWHKSFPCEDLPVVDDDVSIKYKLAKLKNSHQSDGYDMSVFQ